MSDLFTRQRSPKITESLPIRIVYGLEGTAKDGKDLTLYLKMFHDRYARLSALIRPQGSYIPIQALYSGLDRKYVSVIGMVSDLITTRKSGSKLIYVDDPTGSLKTIVTKKKADLYNAAETILLDEVVGLTGMLSDDKSILFVSNITRPDIPLTFRPHRSPIPAKACFISDIHIGSNTFLPHAWERFIDWLSTSDVNYLLIAGDVVDGIGIYPGQEEELLIQSIYEQYAELATALKRIPSHIRVIISLGNHDVVRGAEPQPALPEKFRSGFSNNVVFVENPAYVPLNGVMVLMYHGRSFDDYIKFLPGASYDNISYVMEEVLRRRHLCCTFGEKTPIIPSRIDTLVIDPIPDIFHTGHVHIMGISEYRNILCINAGCWQDQTAYQKQFGTVPTPGKAVILNLQTFEKEVKDFM